MAINKKLINFATRANFDQQLANSNIDNKSIVFINDTQEIWTHGTFFSTYPTSKIQTQVNSSISAIKIGGRNLLKLSGVVKTNAGYNIATYSFGDFIPVAGEVYTVTVKFSLGADRTKLSVFTSDGYLQVTTMTNAERNAQGFCSKTFTMSYYTGRTPAEGYTRIQLYQIPNTGTTSSTVEWIKLESGDKATDWTPAPEDVDASIATKLSLSGGTMTGAITSSIINSFTTPAESWIGPSSTTGVYFKGGNVGIGTTTPGAKLDVNGNVLLSGSGRSLQIGSDSGAYIYLNNANNNISYIANQFQFNTTQSQGFTFNGGNVGIGTTLPNADLHIGSGGLGYIDRTRLIIQPPQHTGGPWKINARDDSTYAYLDFSYGSNKHFILNSSGNVGIGTTTPSSKLSINGGLHVGGDSDAGDNNILADGTITGLSFIGAGTGLTGTASSLSIGGNASTATTATNLTRAGDSITTAPANYGLRFDTTIVSTTAGIFPTSNNANTVITFNRHPGAYDSQLGFSSNGNIYYRAFTAVALNTTQAWKTLLDSDNYNTYAPTKTGTGASGTWGISITGNAATATALTTSAGSATTPIYFSGGKPVAATAYASASVNYATSAGTATNATNATKVNNNLILKFDTGTTEGTSLYTFDGSSAKTIDIKAGSNVSISKAAGIITISSTDTNTVYTHPTTSGNLHIPSGGASGQILRWSADGTATWGSDNNTTYNAATSSTLGLSKLFSDTVQSVVANTVTTTASRTYGLQLNSSGQLVVNVPWTDNNTTYSNFTGATASVNGTAGLVPLPTIANYNYFLKGTGGWSQIAYSDLTGTVPTWNQSTTGNAATVTLTVDNSTNATNYLLFADSATGNKSPRTDTGLTYNPSTGILTSNAFSGSLSGTVNGLTLSLGGSSGSSNIAVGSGALNSNTSGYYNVAIGTSSLYSNLGGDSNTANGRDSLYYNTSGDWNTAIGFGSLFGNITGNNNTALGYHSGKYLSDGASSRTTGNNGLYLGYNSKASANATDNEIVIGYNAVGNGSNTVTIGNTSITDTYIKGKLHVSDSGTVSGITNTSQYGSVTTNLLNGGYAKLPSGIIMQYGRYGVGSVTGEGRFRFPIDFPTDVVSVNITLDNNDYGISYPVSIVSFTTTQVSVDLTSNLTYKYFHITAFGY